MGIIDEKGRLFGRLNVIDLLAVAIVCVLTAAVYVKLTSAYRLAPQYLLPREAFSVDVELRLPPDQAWMADYVAAGMRHVDAHSGRILAEILGVEPTPGGSLAVRVRLLVVEGQLDRVLFNGTPVVPGQRLRIETERCVVEGCVSSIPERVP
ncbi:MAG: DUF4330 domain-containing protein [Candidatus Hydrogenedentes bacterium]|nr:DUF4330 domain-containing protein [Candidatus Hydrogenedentota bacterium]